jgi:glycosyltransferase involved in cell wall biosynthesis
MRIGFDTTSLSVPQSGVGTYTANLYHHLRRYPADEVLPLSHTAPQHEQRRPRINRTLWMQTVLPAHLTRLKLDVAHFTNSTAPVWSPCPSVLTIHDMTLWLMPGFHPAQRLFSMRPIIPLAARRAAAIIAVSECTKADIINLLCLPAEKIHVVYEAAAPSFHPIENAALLEAMRHRYDLFQPFILYVGTIEPRKNLVRLLEAYADLRQGGLIDHRLVFVGSSGWKNDSVYAAVTRLNLADDLRFLGHVPLVDLVALYNLASVVAFPSLYEGFGLPVIEAMACGTPVVTSESSSLREISGYAAELVDPTSVESISYGLCRVLTDAAWRAELRRRGLARAAEFTWEAVAAQTRQVYASVI